MRCRAGWTPFIILVPLAALTILVCVWLGATLRHTYTHLPRVLEAQLSAALRREVKIGKLEGDFWHGLELRDVAIARTKRLSDGALLRIRRARVRYSLDAFLSRTAPPLESIRAIEIEDPWLFVSRDARGRLNLQDLVPPGPPRKGPPPRFPTTVIVRRGTVVFEDHRVPGGHPLTHRLTGIDLTLDGRAAPLYSATLRAQGHRGLHRIALNASVDPESGSVSVLGEAKGVTLASWLPYVPPTVHLPLKLDGGTVDVDGYATLVAGKLADFSGRVALRDGAVRVPQLKQPVHGIAGTFDVSPDSLTAQDVRLSAGRIALRGSATVVDFHNPRMRARVSATGIHEADVRALVPGLPPLPDVRLGRIDNVEVTAEGPVSSPSARARFDLTSVSRPEGHLSDVHVEARLADMKHVVVESLTARVAGGTLAATGDAELTDKGPRYSVQAALRGVELGRLNLKERLQGSAVAGTVSADVQVTGTGSRPQGRARLDLMDARWQEWRADAVQADCAYDGSVVGVRRAQVRVPEGLVSAHGTVDLRGPVKLQVAATRVDLTALAKRYKVDQLRGTAYLRGEVVGDLTDPGFRGEMAAYDLAYADYSVEMLRANVVANMKEVRIEECRGFMLPAQMGNVAVTLTDPRAGTDAEVAATGTVIGLDIARLTQRFQVKGDWGGTVDVEDLEISGPLNAPEVTARVTARNLRGSGHVLDEVTGRVTAALHLPEKPKDPVTAQIRIAENDPVTATILGSGSDPRATSQMRVWGTISPERKLDLHVATVEGKPIRPEQFYTSGGFSIAGELGADLRVTGTVDEPVVRGGTLVVQKLLLNGRAFGNGTGGIEASKESVRIDRLVLIGAGRQEGSLPQPGQDEREEQYELTGTLWPRLDLTAGVVRAPLPKLLALAGVHQPGFEIEGSVTALIRIKQAVQPEQQATGGDGPTKGWPQVSLARLDVDGGRIGPQRIALLRAKGVSWDQDAVTLDALDVGLPEGATLHVDGKASLLPDGPLDFKLDAEKLDLALLQPWVELPAPIGGIGTLKETTISGTMRNPALAGSLAVANPRYGGMPLDSLAVHLAYRDGVAQATDLVARKGQYTVSGHAKVPIDWEKLTAPRPKDGGAAERREVVAADARIEGQVRIEERDLTGLVLFSPKVLETDSLKDGRISGQLDVGGTFGEPDLRGAILVRCPSLILGDQPKGGKPEPALHLWGIDGAVNLEGKRIVVDHLSVASAQWPKDKQAERRLLASAVEPKGPPALKLEGVVTLDGFSPDKLDLRLAARGFDLDERNLSGQFQEQIRLSLHGNATVQGPWESPLVAGGLDLWHAEVDASRITPPTKTAEPLKLAVNPRFDLSVLTKGDAKVLAPRTTAFVSIDSKLKGSLEEILLEGKAKASGGSINLPTAHFRLREADVDFRMSQAGDEAAQGFRATGTALLTTNLRGKNPRTGKEDGFAVTADVTIDYPSRNQDAQPVDMALSARPFLEEADIWPMLMRTDVIEGIVSGRAGGNLQDQIKKEAMSYMATALQPYVLEPVERAIADYLGLTEFSIKASFDEPVEVKFGKHLVEGVRVSYARTVTAREARYTFKLDYEVIDRVSLSWSTDEKRSRTVGLEAGLQF